MAIYCELPGEHQCDIGWERLFCTKEWLEEQIREIRGYSRERRIQLGHLCIHDILTCLSNTFTDKEMISASFVCLNAFAFGIAALNRSAPTQSWKEEVAEMYSISPETLEDKVEPFEDRKRFTYQIVITSMTVFGPQVDRPIGSQYLQLCICVACADTPNEAAFDWIRKIHQEHLLLLERWDHALRMSEIGGDDSEMSVADDYRDEKAILPLREYRRQQRAAERKARQMQADAQAQEKAEEEQRLKRMEEEYQSKLDEWETQCAKMQQEQERAFAQQVAREMAALKNAAKQRYDQVVLENDRIISEQQKRQADAEATLAKLGVLKLTEKARQKRVIREAEEAISSAVAAKDAAKEVYDREQRDAEEQVAKAEPRIREDITRAYPLPQKPLSPEERRQLQEYQKFAAYLRDIMHDKQFTAYEVWEQLSPEIEELSIFGSPYESVSIRKLAIVLGKLAELGLVEKSTEKRRNYYAVM